MFHKGSFISAGKQMVGLLIFHILLLYIILTLVEEIAQLLLESLESVEFGLAAVPGSPGFNLVRSRERRRG